MASSLIKASSFLVNRGDSKPSLKWMRNPLLRTTTTQIISLPSSMMMMMIKNNSTNTTTSGFIQTIKCSSSSSSSRRGSALRVQCVVMNNNSSSSKKNCCFKKEEQVEEEENPLKQEFGKGMLKVLKALTTPVVSAKLVDLLLTKYPTLASTRTAIFFAVMVAYDLCRAIVSRRRIGDGLIRFTLGDLGPVLGSIFVFLYALMTVFGYGTVTWEEEGTENTITHKIIGYMVKIMMFMWMFMVMLFGFGSTTMTWPPLSEKANREV